MMAKELILLSKRKYEELLKFASEHRQETPTGGVIENEENETPEVFRPTEQLSNSTQTGNGMFVEKIDDDADGTPGILDHSPKKIRKKMKRNVKWISY